MNGWAFSSVLLLLLPFPLAGSPLPNGSPTSVPHQSPLYAGGLGQSLLFPRAPLVSKTPLRAEHLASYFAGRLLPSWGWGVELGVLIARRQRNRSLTGTLWDFPFPECSLFCNQESPSPSIIFTLMQSATECQPPLGQAGELALIQTPVTSVSCHCCNPHDIHDPLATWRMPRRRQRENSD